MSKIVYESGVNFGPFDENEFFHIEKSKIYQKLGEDIKTVEFVFLQKNKNLIFLEAKTTCPNAEHRYDTSKNELKYDEYYSDITQKIKDSMQLLIAALVGRIEDTDEIGKDIKKKSVLKEAKFKFVLVITTAKATESWLPGPKAEIEQRLLPLRKIWGFDIIVLNKSMAIERGLILRDDI